MGPCSSYRENGTVQQQSGYFLHSHGWWVTATPKLKQEQSETATYARRPCIRERLGLMTTNEEKQEQFEEKQELFEN